MKSGFEVNPSVLIGSFLVRIFFCFSFCFIFESQQNGSAHDKTTH